MSLIVHRVALEMVAGIRPLIDRIGRHDRSLATQIRRSASSVALNIGEGAYSRGGNRTARFQDAAGSASETRSALQVAAAWGYLSWPACETVDAKLDRIQAMLWGLTHSKTLRKRPRLSKQRSSETPASRDPKLGSQKELLEAHEIE